MMVRTPQLHEHTPVTACSACALLEENSYTYKSTNGRATSVSEPQIKAACVLDKCWGCDPNTGSHVCIYGLTWRYLNVELDLPVHLYLYLYLYLYVPHWFDDIERLASTWAR